MSVLLQYNFTSSLSPSTVVSGVSGSDITNGSLTTMATTSLGYSSDPVLQLAPTGSGVDAASAISSNSYFFFTITPNGGKKISLTTLTWNGARGNVSTPRGWAVRSSIDSYSSSLGAADYTAQRTTFEAISIDLSGAAFQNVTSPITFRIYVYCPASSNTVETDDITLNGAVANTGNTSGFMSFMI
jgi:hypothetical protein